jgi:hypothetical protein
MAAQARQDSARATDAARAALRTGRTEDARIQGAAALRSTQFAIQCDHKAASLQMACNQIDIAKATADAGEALGSAASTIADLVKNAGLDPREVRKRARGSRRPSPRPRARRRRSRPWRT